MKNKIKSILIASKKCDRTLKIMKISTLLFFLCLFSITAENVYPQQAELSLELRNVTIKKAISEIEKISDYVFLITGEAQSELNRRTSLRANKESIHAILGILLKDTALGYTVVERQVSVYKSVSTKAIEKAVAKPEEVQQQKKTVTGKITDEQGEPVIGANIIEQGTTNGTVTDVDGNFSLNVTDNSSLQVTYIGYLSQTINTAGENTFFITLHEDVHSLEDLVVVGYGTQKKINLTGAIDVVKGEELVNRMTSSVLSSLQGVAPNLNISYGYEGGEPGSSPAFNIRGMGSLSGGSALVLVDGVQQNMNSLNPNDIESISILKDASASAIYGARAAYGVILITTKKGTSDSKPTISYTFNPAWQKPTKLPDIVSSIDFATMVNDAFFNAGQAAKFTPQHINLIKYNIVHPGVLPSMRPHPLSPNDWDTSMLYGNTNAYEEFYNDFSFNQNHNLSVSGGGKSFTYFVSGGYYHEGPQFKYGEEYYERYNLTANFNTQISEWLNIGVNSKYTKREYEMPHQYANIGNFYHDVPRRWPIWPVYDPNGHFAINTMALMAEGGKRDTDENQLVNSIIGQIDLTEKWKVNFDFNFRHNFNSSTDIAKLVYLYHVDNTPYADWTSSPSSYNNGRYNSYFQTNNIYSTFETNLDKNFFRIMGGMQSEYFQDESLGVQRNNLLSNDVPFLTTATGTESMSGAKGHWGTLGFFGRFNYNFDERILVELSGRFDGTSRFQEDSRWGFFPSFSVGYNIAREPFWSNLIEDISLLKIRASYGELGNQSVGNNFPYLSNLGIQNKLPFIINSERPLYVTAPGLVSPELTWETAATSNLGLDFQALNNRFSLAFDIYKRTTFDMFGPLESYPAVLGTNPPRRNNASMETKGFELNLGWRDSYKNIQYYANFILSDNYSRITKYQNNTGTLSDYYEGLEIGEIWGFTTVGLFQSEQEILDAPDQSYRHSRWNPGDVRFKDMNEDGVIDQGNFTLSDPGDLSVIGNNSPRYSFGLNLGLSWKGVYMDMLWQGVAKRDWVAGATNFYFGDSGNYNQITIFKEHLDYWSPDNTDAFYPRPYMTGEAHKNLPVQTRYTEDASYLRLKNLQIGYDFPTKLADKLFLSSLRIYLTGENLLTFTNLIPIFDPENLSGSFGAGKAYPLSTVYSLGLNLTLK